MEKQTTSGNVAVMFSGMFEVGKFKEKIDAVTGTTLGKCVLGKTKVVFDMVDNTLG